MRGLVPFAKCSERNAERDTHRLVVGQYELALPIPIHTVLVEKENIAAGAKLPLLHLSDWASYLLETNSWHLLCGLRSPDRRREGAIWESFWEKYRALDPRHPIYEMAARNELVLSRTAGVVLHGDEGRGRRRQAFLVVSYRSMLGRGSAPARRDARRKRRKQAFLKLKTNFKGDSLTTHFLAGALPRSEYVDDDSTFDMLMNSVAEQAHLMCTSGVVDSQGSRHWMLLLRSTGDWPWHHKSAKLKRTFSNAIKRVGQKPAGMCHLCNAGMEGFPWEQISTRRPRWAETLNASSPFAKEPALSVVPHTSLQEMYAFDIFHTWHLGIGRSFLGSALAMLSMLEPAGNVDQRFDSLNRKYRLWCKSVGRPPIASKLSKELVQWPSTSEFPTGSWYKGGLTTTLMLWFESLDGTIHGEMCTLAMDAAKTINSFLRLLYRSDVFLSVDNTRLAGELCCKFLRRYGELAALAKAQHTTLWILQPKLHCLHHMGLELLKHASRGCEGLNPVALSTQLSEDFISKPSRLSRRVAAATTMKRVIERHLQASYKAWVKAGLLIETSAF